jgi:hypothetical protein
MAEAVKSLLDRGSVVGDDDAWLAEYNWDAMANRVIKALQI